MGILDATGKRILDTGLEEGVYFKAVQELTDLQTERPNHPLVKLLLPCIEVDLGEEASQAMWEKLATLYYNDHGEWHIISPESRDEAVLVIFGKVREEIFRARKGLPTAVSP